MKNILNTKVLLVFFLTSFFITHTQAQGVGINSNGNTADPSAILDLNVSPGNDKGFLMPRITTAERDLISSPAEGLQIFNTTTKCFEAYVLSAWHTVSCPAACNSPAATTEGTHTPSQTQIVWNWNTVSNASGYKYNTTNDYGTATDNATSTSFTQTGLNCATPYSLYVWAYNNCGNSSSVTMNETTTGATIAAPTEGSHTPSQTQIVWNWNSVSGATGYKYNTVNNYSTATDNGTSTTHTQTGLTCATPYTLYVWAYDICGNSNTTTLTETTSGATGNITYTANGTFTVPTCVTNICIEVWSGGGGGGGRAQAAGCNVCAEVAGGGGGGGGGYGQQCFNVVPGTDYAVTIGAGGTGGSGIGCGGTAGNGTAGGTTSVGALISAIGGSGGTGAVAGTPGSGGAGGTSSATTNATGTTGGNGGNGCFAPGSGGTGANGNIAPGGRGGDNTLPNSGFPGTAGQVIITW